MAGSMSQLDYRQMANQCLSLAETATDEQHKSVLLRAAAKLNELADRHLRPRDRRSWPVRYSNSAPTLPPPVPLPTAPELEISKPASDIRKEDASGTGPPRPPKRYRGRYQGRW